MHLVLLSGYAAEEGSQPFPKTSDMAEPSVHFNSDTTITISEDTTMRVSEPEEDGSRVNLEAQSECEDDDNQYERALR